MCIDVFICTIYVYVCVDVLQWERKWTMMKQVVVEVS